MEAPGRLGALVSVVALAATWIGIAWVAITIPAALVAVSVVYGALALYSLVDFAREQHQAELRQKVEELNSEAAGGGLRGLAFWLAKPLYHFVSLPYRSLALSIVVALLLATPAIFMR